MPEDWGKLKGPPLNGATAPFLYAIEDVKLFPLTVCFQAAMRKMTGYLVASIGINYAIVSRIRLHHQVVVGIRFFRGRFGII